MTDELDGDRIPPDPATLITALAEALADVHLGRNAMHSDNSGDDLITFDHRSAADLVTAAALAGRVPAEGSPFRRAGAATVAEVVVDGVGDIERRSDSLTATIGLATFRNLVLARPDAGAELSAAANLTFRRPRSTAVDRPAFAEWSDAASSDPYRDLAIAAAEVIATFGSIVVGGSIMDG